MISFSCDFCCDVIFFSHHCYCDVQNLQMLTAPCQTTLRFIHNFWMWPWANSPVLHSSRSEQHVLPPFHCLGFVFNTQWVVKLFQKQIGDLSEMFFFASPFSDGISVLKKCWKCWKPVQYLQNNAPYDKHKRLYGFMYSRRSTEWFIQ